MFATFRHDQDIDIFNDKDYEICHRIHELIRLEVTERIIADGEQNDPAITTMMIQTMFY